MSQYLIQHRSKQEWDGKPAPWVREWMTVHRGAKDYYTAFIVMTRWWSHGVDESDWRIKRYD